MEAQLGVELVEQPVVLEVGRRDAAFGVQAAEPCVSGSGAQILGDALVALGECFGADFEVGVELRENSSAE